VGDESIDSNGAGAKANECSFEDSLAALEQAVHDLEDGNLGLTEALDRYETGVRHLKRCYQLLDAAERRIELLTGVNEDGTPSTESFAESGESLAESTGRRRRARAKPVGENGVADQ